MELLDLAARQHGTFTWEQARQSAVAEHQLLAMCRSGIVERVQPSV